MEAEMENKMENPNDLGDPERADDAGHPDEPDRADDAGHPDEPDGAGNAGCPDEADDGGQLDEPGRAGNAGCPDEADDGGQPDESDGAGKAGCPDEADDGGQPDKPSGAGNNGCPEEADFSNVPIEISQIEHECERKCSSEKHAANLTAVLTKDSFDDNNIAAYWKWCCARYHEAVDHTGRTLLHMAAAKGRTKLVKFLLTHDGIDIQKKDKESNFTPLHCSMFYGHIDSAVHLIGAGASLDELDGDKMSPLDHLSVDSGTLTYREYDTCPHDVYVWGTNENYVLGVGDGRKRGSPDAMEFFKKQRVHLNKVIFGKYHSAFLARDGRLWMCGQGFGGRLGLDEESQVLTPKPIIVSANNPECVSVALGRDHTVMVMADKTVWSFGLNSYHQLGHDPPPDKVLRPKFVRGLRHVGIIGTSASTYHSAFWTDSRLYTCGLNGGQLGHSRDSGATMIIPKVVSGLRQCSIKIVTCTVGATVLANSYGEIYLFYNYICRKITSRPFYPKLVCALGGRLDHKLDTDILQPYGGRELEVLVVTSCSSVYIWKESDRRYLKYDIGLEQRIVNIIDITFHSCFCMLVTRDGKAYFGKIAGNRSIGTEVNSESSRNYIELTRIPLIHRAVAMTSDPGGGNYAIVQYQPKCRLHTFPRPNHSEADTHMRNLYRVLERESYLQDVEFEVKGVRIPAHRYIVAYGSKVLETMMNEAVQPDGTCVVQIDNVSPRVFRALLCFMYTRDYNLITPYPIGSTRTCEEMKMPFEFNGKKYMPIKEPPMSGKEKSIFQKSLERAAKIFGVRGLVDDAPSTDGLLKRTRSPPTGHVRFEREKYPELWDTILVSEDGMEIRAHKCILIARLEYFNSMMNNQSWRESIKDELIDLPLPGEVLTILINYLYTGGAPSIVKTDDLDLVFLTLIISDQLFCEGLKNICEYTLGSLMNLDNAAEIYQMGLFYNAENLKQYALEFIMQNLGYMLEKGVLENLHDFVLTSLASFYRTRVPQMCMRHITAFSNAPDESFVEYIGKTEPVNIDMGRKDFNESPSTSSDNGGSSGSQDSEFESEADRPRRWLKRKERQLGVLAKAKSLRAKRKEKAKALPEQAKAGLKRAKEQKAAKAGQGARKAGTRAARVPGTSEGTTPETEGEDDPSRPVASSSNAVACARDPAASRKEGEKSAGNQGNTNAQESVRRRPALLSPRHLSESDYPDETDSSEASTTNEEDSSSRGAESQSDSKEQSDGDQAAARRRVAPKTLADIQAEERAIRELRALYNADTVKDERVSVRRLDCRRRRPRPRASARS